MAKFDEGGRGVAYNPPFERTGKPYAFELCDHYNRSMLPEADARGCEWFVDNLGNVRLGFPAATSTAISAKMDRRADNERRDWIYRNRGDFSA